jgi:hypothetical protein
MVDPTAEASSPTPDRASKFKAALREGARILLAATGKIVPRMLLWGFIGTVLPVVADIVLFAAGLLAHPWPPWRYLWLSLLPIHATIGAIALGYAGLWRGLGRAALYVGVELGYTSYAIDAIVRRANALLRSNAAAAGAMERGEQWLQNVPLDRAEGAIKTALDQFLATDEIDGQGKGLRKRFFGVVKRTIVKRIEAILLKVVRSERDAQGQGGGISMQKVHEFALAQADRWVTEFVEGKMNLITGLMIALTLLALAIAPVLVAVLR